MSPDEIALARSAYEKHRKLWRRKFRRLYGFPATAAEIANDPGTVDDENGEEG